jgi:hypothetical protein
VKCGKASEYMTVEELIPANRDHDYSWSRDKMLEVDILDAENFLKIKETLTRMGLASSQNKTLYQSAHILHKTDADGVSRYYIVHFKEMFLLDHKESTLTTDDIARRNAIAYRLQEWGLLKVLNTKALGNVEDLNFGTIKVIPFREKKLWKLIPKYEIGNSTTRKPLPIAA